MAVIYTFPDFNFNRAIKKILIRNAPWDDTLLQTMADSLSDKEYEIYVHQTSVTDVQWLEGVRMASSEVIDWRHKKDLDPLTFIKELDDAN